MGLILEHGHRRNAQANGGGLQSSLVVARWPVFRPSATWSSDGLSWCRLLVESAWSSVLIRFELLTVHWYVWLLWLYGGLTECYSSVSELGLTVDTCSACWWIRLLRSIQRFFVRQWVRFCQSTKAWVLFPFTVQCLVLCGTCYASVTWCFWSGRVDFPVVVQRPIPHGLACGRPQKFRSSSICLVVDAPVVEVVFIARRCATTGAGRSRQCRKLWMLLLDKVDFTQVQFLDEVVFMPVVGQRLALIPAGFPTGAVVSPVVAQRQIPMVSLTMEIIQLQLIDKVFDGRLCMFLGCRRGEDSRAPQF